MGQRTYPIGEDLSVCPSVHGLGMSFAHECSKGMSIAYTITFCKAFIGDSVLDSVSYSHDTIEGFTGSFKNRRERIEYWADGAVSTRIPHKKMIFGVQNV